ncbi:MAG: hypothetical protein OXU23_17330 [Candidatus Poribacteria bacterium]|nr:hypothetical protein [Candidatus Poribacteria bacterium]
MVIDILTLPQFTELDIQAPRGHQNSGGGMACLMNAAKAVLSNRYRVNICVDFSDLKSDIVIIDAVLFAKLDETGSFQPEKLFELLQNDKNEHPKRRYLLWCAEMTMIRLPSRIRGQIIELVDAIAVTDPYIWNLFRAIGITPMGYLCDCIDPDLFRPGEKEMIVTAVGALKHIKNVDWIIEIYKLLEGKIKRTYFGSAALWSSENRPEDNALIPKIEAVTEAYYPSASPVEVAYYNSKAAFAVNNTWHDCSSRSNEELLMSGVISIHGEHPLFDPRPGFRIKTPQEAVEKIAELTDNFTRLPDPKLHEDSRDWALRNVSTQSFMAQFENLMRSIL